MPYSYLIALTHFVEGREDDYNDWYQWVHLRDVMRLGVGVVAAQRFRNVPVPGQPKNGVFNQPYLCIYEVTDPIAMTQAHGPVFTDAMPISDAYTSDGVSEIYFDEIAGFNQKPGSFGSHYVIIERVDAAAHSAELEVQFLRDRFSAIRQLPGMIAGSVGRPSSHQMFEQDNVSGLCAVYWTTDPERTAKAWPSLHGPAGLPALDPAAFSLNAYEAVMDRLTMIDVRAPTEADRITAQGKRDQLGSRVLSGPPATIKSEHFG